MAIKVPRAPPPSSAAASAAMRGNTKKNTRPELIVRRTAHRLGARYRLYRDDLPGKPDLVLPRRRLVIFVHGCFWHSHDSAACPLRRKAETANHYWSAKLARNAERDLENRARLEGEGWRVSVIWECETRDPDLIERKLAALLQ
jgi:DNA mismatch endonuclease (patch repair protein)